jgi:hypothetical protein
MQFLDEGARILGEKFENGKFADPRTASPARETRALPYVRAMH